MESAIENDKIQ